MENEYRLLQGDCLEVMKEIPDGSVDFVLTSPPYNINLMYSGGRYSKRTASADGGINTKYINNNDDLSMDEYFSFIDGVVEQCLRVSDTVFFNIQQVTGNKSALYRLLGKYHDKIKEVIIWDKVNAQPAVQQNVLNSQFEFIFVFQNSRPQVRAFDLSSFERGTMSNVWSIKREVQPLKGLGAAFPLSLASHIIKNFTRTGQTVLDPFMGSGTTGIAALNLNRKFIGIELDETYFNSTKTRIETHKPQPELF